MLKIEKQNKKKMINKNNSIESLVNLKMKMKNLKKN
jgi:hypothetical protein